MGGAKDPMRFKAISKVSIENGIVAQYFAAEDETFGEPVFKSIGNENVEDSGFVFVPGYSANRDESFLDILEAETMKSRARLWVGAYFPVGFHGSFIS